MSFKKFFLITILFSISVKAAWYQPGLNFIEKNKKPLGALALAGTLYAGWRLYQSRTQLPKPEAQKPLTEEELRSILMLMHGCSIKPESLATPVATSSSSSVLPVPPSTPIAPITAPEDDRKKRIEEAAKDKSEKESKEKDEDFVDIDPASYPTTLAEIQAFCDSINFKKIVDMCKLLGLNIASYDLSGPLLYDQLILENLRLIEQRIETFKKLISNETSLNSDGKKIWINRLEKTNHNCQEIYKRGPWVHGKKIFRDLLSGANPEEYRKTWEEHWRNIACMVWYLHELALSKNQTFVEGTYNIEDKVIFDFMVSYKYAYDRSGKLKSSHYHEIDEPKFGINIPEEARTKFTLPNNKLHILIGNINGGPYMPLATDRFIFMVKPENYPTENPEPKSEVLPYYHFDRDLLKHGYEYVIAQFRKVAGSNEQDYMRKEHLPYQIYLALANLYYANFPLEASWLDSVLAFLPTRFQVDKRPSLLKDIEKFGIKAIVHHAKRLTGDSPAQNAAREKLDALLKNYDHLEFRKGREVIFTRDEIARAVGIS